MYYYVLVEYRIERSIPKEKNEKVIEFMQRRCRGA